MALKQPSIGGNKFTLMLCLLLISVVFCVFERRGVSLLSPCVCVCVCVCERDICVFLAGRGGAGIPLWTEMATV